MSLYVYCLGDELRADSFGELRGVGGARVRVVALGRLAAVVSESGGEGAEVSAENVRAHSGVNAAALARATPLPFRFGTVADEHRLAAYVSENEAALLGALARVRGCVEMSVKVRRADEKAEGEGQNAKGEGEEDEGGWESGPGIGATEASARVGRGTAFLLAKRREVLGDEARRRGAEEVAAWLASRVSGLVRESSARVHSAGALFVRASHLVERARLEEYRARVRELTSERADLHFLASGPWPPYSFSDLGRK